MASVSHDKKTGRRTIQVVQGKGKRLSIRLGKVTSKQAQLARRHIEHLQACRTMGTAPDMETANWLAGLSDRIHARIVKAGLAQPRVGAGVPTLGQWLEQYINGRTDVKGATRTVYGHTRRNLLAFFGAGRALDAISSGDADAFAVHLRTEAMEVTNDEGATCSTGLSENTVRRRLGIAKQFFRAAMRRKLIPQNPFEDQCTAVGSNPKKEFFIDHEMARAVLDALPDPGYRLVFALARYGGLRCPSEILRLKWEDVSWDRLRFTVHASKTEHHEHGGIRVVPIFPELLPYLREAFEAAEPGAVYCCPQYNLKSAGMMYRKRVLDAIKAAGLKPWPKLFQNLRSSRETELVDDHPEHAVCAWLGNSRLTARKHYFQVTEKHFERATSTKDRREAGRRPSPKALQKAVQ